MKKILQLFRRRKSSAKFAEGGVTIEGDPEKYPEGSPQRSVAALVQKHNEMAEEAGNSGMNVSLEISADEAEVFGAAIERRQELMDKGALDLSPDELQEWDEIQETMRPHQQQLMNSLEEAGATGMPWQPPTEEGAADEGEGALEAAIGEARERDPDFDEKLKAWNKAQEGEDEDDEPSGPRKRCPKGSRKDDSGTCQKYSEAEATDDAESPSQRVMRRAQEAIAELKKKREESGAEKKDTWGTGSGTERCPKGSRKDDSGTCQKYSEAEATDPAPKKKTLRERLGAKKKCDDDCPDDNDGRQAKQFKAPPGREEQVKALKKEDVKNPYAVAWSSYDAKNAESYAPICFSDNQLPGGDFDAVQNEDGTWNIGIDKDIPIMGTVQEVGVKGNERPIGIKWLRAALRKHRALEEQPGGAYYAPVHLRHHAENSDHDETVPAGFLRLNRIAPAFDGGDNQAAIFATLYNVPDEIYQQIKAKKWAFRSVEVASWDKPQVSSLSLLNTEAPFFKYPNLTIGNETPAVAVNVLPLEAAAPALALCESGAGGSILFNFSEARRMAEEKIKEEIEIEEDLDLNDEDVDVDVDVDEDEEGATLSELAGMMRELMRRLDDEVEDEEVIEEVRDKRNEDVPVDIAASAGKMAAMLSEISGRVSGLESNQRKGRQRQALASYVEKSLGKLSGYNLPDSLGDTMTKMAQTAGGNYKKLLDQFVSTFKATASRDEDLATLDDFEQSISIGQGDEALAKFAQKGEASLTNARKHLRTFKSLQDKGVRFADGVDDPANFIDILTNETNTEN